MLVLKEKLRWIDAISFALIFTGEAADLWHGSIDILRPVGTGAAGEVPSSATQC